MKKKIVKNNFEKNRRNKTEKNINIVGKKMKKKTKENQEISMKKEKKSKQRIDEKKEKRS